MMIDSRFGTLVRKLRISKEMTLKDVARLTGKAICTVSNWESFRTQIPYDEGVQILELMKNFEHKICSECRRKL